MATFGKAGMAAEGLFAKFRDALEVAGIPYMVTGSFVSAVQVLGSGSV
jgi:hypothetical protein